MGTKSAAPDTESMMAGTENVPGTEVVGLGSVNASTCGAIATFSELSDAAKCGLAGSTIKFMVAMRVEGSAANRAIVDAGHQHSPMSVRETLKTGRAAWVSNPCSRFFESGGGSTKERPR